MKDPARVKLRGSVAVRSSALSVTTKKPEPETARSVDELVCCTSPCSVRRLRVAVVTPAPPPCENCELVTTSRKLVSTRL